MGTKEADAGADGIADVPTDALLYEVERRLRARAADGGTDRPVPGGNLDSMVTAGRETELHDFLHDVRDLSELADHAARDAAERVGTLSDQCILETDATLWEDVASALGHLLRFRREAAALEVKAHQVIGEQVTASAVEAAA